MVSRQCHAAFPGVSPIREEDMLAGPTPGTATRQPAPERLVEEANVVIGDDERRDRLFHESHGARSVEVWIAASH